MRYQGRITRWNNEREFGFITPNGSRNLVFVHKTAFLERPRRPVINEVVSYELTSPDPNERPVAENVTFVDDSPQDPDASRRWQIVFALAALLLCGVIAWLFTAHGSDMLRAFPDWQGGEGLARIKRFIDQLAGHP